MEQEGAHEDIPSPPFFSFVKACCLLRRFVFILTKAGESGLWIQSSTASDLPVLLHSTVTSYLTCIGRSSSLCCFVWGVITEPYPHLWFSCSLHFGPSVISLWLASGLPGFPFFLIFKAIEKMESKYELVTSYLLMPSLNHWLLMVSHFSGGPPKRFWVVTYYLYSAYLLKTCLFEDVATVSFVIGNINSTIMETFIMSL